MSSVEERSGSDMDSGMLVTDSEKPLGGGRVQQVLGHRRQLQLAGWLQCIGLGGVGVQLSAIHAG